MTVITQQTRDVLADMVLDRMAGLELRLAEVDRDSMDAYSLLAEHARVYRAAQELGATATGRAAQARAGSDA